ncbi:hypothetical protein HUJ05_002122 [Dendroctonus ponderosae]|nr:hypothetical protein HUJ05_002122 [Dendroctonus ponderosae]
MTTEEVAEKTEKYTTRFWAEIFGTIHIGFSFLTSFILQLLSICRPLAIGLIQLGSDYFFKPFLATIFNGIIQPVLTFFYNILASMRDLCEPISDGIGYFIREISFLVRSFRIVEFSREGSQCESTAKKTNG